MRIESLPIDMNRKRAMWAYELIEQLIVENDQMELKALCRRLPTILKGNGLITMLYYLKKNDKKYHLYEPIINVIRKIPFIEASTTESCIDELLNLPDSKYRMVQKDVIEYAIWLKKTAEAMISD